MSILDKHPAPWTRNAESVVVDANGKTIEFSAELDRLGLSAPELLAALKRRVEDDESEHVMVCRSDIELIARIENP